MNQINEQHPEFRAKQAFFVWLVFFLVNILLNGTIQFIVGVDMMDWTYSPLKGLLYHLIIYSGLFLVVPMILTKGWNVVKKPDFLIPLIIAVIGMSLGVIIRPLNIIGLIFLIYAHWRFNLSEIGIRSKGYKGDIGAVVLMGLLVLILVFMRSALVSLNFPGSLLAMIDRMFFNPASFVENLFYFGFLTEALSKKINKYILPFIIGLMYTAHEMSNPEYWYENVFFITIFFGVATTAAIYLWRRSVVVIWCGDGLQRFITTLFV